MTGDFRPGLYEISYDDQPEIEYMEMTSKEAREEYDRLVRIHNGGVIFRWICKHKKEVYH